MRHRATGFSFGERRAMHYEFVKMYVFLLQLSGLSGTCFEIDVRIRTVFTMYFSNLEIIQLRWLSQVLF